MALIALLIKADSSGPVLYRQLRVGRYNRDFWMYKFRTMKVNADREGLLTMQNRDPRLTHIGYWLRRYKLDELTQLWNVLNGDMSLVGPRPEVRKYVDLYTTAQLEVLKVRPGISDAASIKYANETELLGAQTDPERYYIEVIMPDKLNINLATLAQSQSVKGSLVIILKTIARVLRK